VVLGILLCAYGAAVVVWRDPVTDVYAAWKQRGLDDTLEAESARYARLARVVEAEEGAESGGPEGGATSGATASRDRLASARRLRRTTARLAGEFAREHRTRTGAPIGRLRIPRMGVSTIVVQGTDYWGALAKGPGHYERTGFPGQGRTVAIAGHRTTFSAPFRRIDVLRKGDTVEVQMPYATLRYRVTSHRIVDDGDWSIVREVGHEQLVLSACHPLYSARQRWVVFAKLDAITAPGGRATSIAQAPAIAS
jgi:sortase A